MRELLFRAYNKHTGEMVYFEGIFNKRSFTEKSAFPQYESCPEYHDLIIDQWTGLVDKNIGKKIYEGDILNVYDWGSDRCLLGVAVVRWDEDEKGWRHHPHYGAEYAYDQFRNVEVIGDIYQNPELLNPIEEEA